jgi:hypothetical protein
MATRVFPIVHLNGTSKRELIDQACEAGRALRAAYDACSNAAPNARDYYLREGSFGLAQAAHVARMNALSEQIAFFQALAIHCDGEEE